MCIISRIGKRPVYGIRLCNRGYMLCSFQALSYLSVCGIRLWNRGYMLCSFQALTLVTRGLQNCLRYALQFSSINSSY
jgi:hypothetical protein